jgi:hypothetical protein
MTIQNKTCVAAIPSQPAGTHVDYSVLANDTLLNVLFAEGSFTIKQHAKLNLTASAKTVYLGENITIHGTLTNGTVNATITLLSSSRTAYSSAAQASSPSSEPR